MSYLFYYYVKKVDTRGGGQDTQQQQWLTSGAWNQGLHHTHPWMQNQMLPHASMNRTQGNALNIPVSAAMYGIFNSQGNTQVFLGSLKKKHLLLKIVSRHFCEC